MADVVVGGNDVSAEESDAELDEAGAVGFNLVGDGADESAFAGTHFLEGLGDAILTGDGEVLLAAELAGGIEDAEGAGISGGGDQDALACWWPLEKLLHGDAARLAHAAAFNLDKAVVRQIGQPLANAVESAGDAALNEAAGLFEADADDPIDFSLPLAEGMLGKQCAHFVAGLKVIDAEVGGVGVRHVNGDEGNVGLA